MAEPCSEQRDDTRFDNVSPLRVKDLGSGAIYEARMQNYSNGGIYFESDGLFRKGTKLYFCIHNSPYVESSGVSEYYTGEVKWRKNLKRSFYDYGYGVQFISGSGEQEYDSDNPIVKESRKHTRVPYFKNVQFSTQKGTHKGKTENISMQGLFIATDAKLEIGQELKLNLPLKKNKTAAIIGQIVWLNEKGFGLKFKKVK